MILEITPKSQCFLLLLGALQWLALSTYAGGESTGSGASWEIIEMEPVLPPTSIYQFIKKDYFYTPESLQVIGLNGQGYTFYTYLPGDLIPSNRTFSIKAAFPFHSSVFMLQQANETSQYSLQKFDASKGFIPQGQAIQFPLREINISDSNHVLMINDKPQGALWLYRMDDGSHQQLALSDPRLDRVISSTFHEKHGLWAVLSGDWVTTEAPWYPIVLCHYAARADKSVDTQPLCRSVPRDFNATNQLQLTDSGKTFAYLQDGFGVLDEQSLSETNPGWEWVVRDARFMINTDDEHNYTAIIPPLLTADAVYLATTHVYHPEVPSGYVTSILARFNLDNGILTSLRNISVDGGSPCSIIMAQPVYDQALDILVVPVSTEVNRQVAAPCSPRGTWLQILQGQSLALLHEQRTTVQAQSLVIEAVSVSHGFSKADGEFMAYFPAYCQKGDSSNPAFFTCPEQGHEIFHPFLIRSPLPEASIAPVLSRSSTSSHRSTTSIAPYYSSPLPSSSPDGSDKSSNKEGVIIAASAAGLFAAAIITLMGMVVYCKTFWAPPVLYKPLVNLSDS